MDFILKQLHYKWYIEKSKHKKKKKNTSDQYFRNIIRTDRHDVDTYIGSFIHNKNVLFWWKNTRYSHTIIYYITTDRRSRPIKNTFFISWSLIIYQKKPKKPWFGLRQGQNQSNTFSFFFIFFFGWNTTVDKSFLYGAWL